MPHLLIPLVVVAAAVVVTGGYALACVVQPMRPCRRCAGSGHRRAVWTSLFGGGDDTCTRCDGTGGQPRWGVRVARLFRA